MEPFDLILWNGFIEAGGTASGPAIIDQITIDSRRIDSKNALFVALEGEIYDGHRFIPQAAKCGARYALAKKGWMTQESLGDLTLLYVDSPLRAFQQIAGIYRRQRSCMVIGIAGSHGKTMVKDLLHAMLETTHSVASSPESFNSQIGVPLSLLTIHDEHKLALIEIGFSQKGEMDALCEMIQADYSIITHVGKKHLSTLGSLDTVGEEMLKLVHSQTKKDWSILPKDEYILAHLPHLHCQHHFWTEYSPHLPHAYFNSQERGQKMPYRIDFPDGQQHFGMISSGFYYFLDLINITVKAAWLLNTPFNLETEIGSRFNAITTALRNYTPEPMRTEIWKSPFGAAFINDTYCSDPQSVDKALKYFKQMSANRKIFAFGGLRDKNRHLEIDYRRIGKAIQRCQIDLLLLYGAHPFKPLIEEMSQISPQTEIAQCESYKEALNFLRERIHQDDVVLIKGDSKHSIDHLSEAFTDSISSNQCFINFAAIVDNLVTIRKKLPPQTRIMIMVKALAYGTDEVRIAKFLETCHVDILGVSYVDEGIALKRAGVKQAIFVINAAHYEAKKVVKWDLEIGVSDSSLIEAIAAEAEKQNKKIKIHLHIDTGMGRFGCRPEEALELAKMISDCPYLQLEGIMTHFACSDDPSHDDFTKSQASLLEKTIEELKKHNIQAPWSHAANSSGAIRFDFPKFNMVRIGLALYGLYSSKATQEAMELRLALSLVTRIVGINTCRSGESISYGRSYHIGLSEQKIAVLPIGYFDGLHRNYSGKGSVIIRGQKAPMVGKICMDFMMVDVTDIPNASPGDPVLIFGEDEYGHYLSPEELASCGNSIIHELITCLGPRIQRIFVYEESRRVH